MEGGNAAISALNEIDFSKSLSLLTTYYLPHIRQFTATGETSAAVSLAARLAAMIQSRYPELWPETIRALIINSCSWTDTMLSRVPQDGSRGANHHYYARQASPLPLPRPFCLDVYENQKEFLSKISRRTEGHAMHSDVVASSLFERDLVLRSKRE